MTSQAGICGSTILVRGGQCTVFSEAAKDRSLSDQMHKSNAAFRGLPCHDRGKIPGDSRLTGSASFFPRVAKALPRIMASGEQLAIPRDLFLCTHVNFYRTSFFSAFSSRRAAQTRPEQRTLALKQRQHNRHPQLKRNQKPCRFLETVRSSA